MKFKGLNGKIQDLPVHKWLIDWDGDSASLFQEECKDFLCPYWKHDVVCEEFKVGRMSLDFVNISKRVAVEVQGRQHTQYVPFLSGTRAGYLSQLKRDMKKADFCRLNNLTLVEILPTDLPLTKEWFKTTYDVDL
jgi:hypothetical protein